MNFSHISSSVDNQVKKVYCTPSVAWNSNRFNIPPPRIPEIIADSEEEDELMDMPDEEEQINFNEKKNRLICQCRITRKQNLPQKVMLKMQHKMELRKN